MLAFGALVDLSRAPVGFDAMARLRQSLPAIPGRVSVAGDAESAVAQLADARSLPFDDELPLRDGALLVAGTLRLDARADLRQALAAHAPREALALASDARLVVWAYRAWGERLAEHLLGDYAFIVWDRDAQRLVCVRDPHGNRQLYWARVGHTVIAASSIATVRAHPGVSSALHERALVDCLRIGWPLERDRTVFRDVHQVAPAHTLVFNGVDAPPRVRRHWTFPEPAPIRYSQDSEYVEHFRDVLAEAVSDRLRGSRAGILLSGGMDSTTLAVSARSASPQVALCAFTVTHPTIAPSGDDTLSRDVATRLGIPQQVLDLDHPPSLAFLADLALLPEQPADEADLASEQATARAVAEFAPVAIIGEDGDALLHAPTLLGQLRTQPAREVASAWLMFVLRTRRRPWVGLDWRARLRRAMHGGSPSRAPWLTAHAARIAASATAAPPPHALRPQAVRLLSSPQWDSVYETLAPVTTRAPLLYTFPLVDPRVLAFVFAIPPVPWCQEKHLFRAAMRGQLPAEVLTRPKQPLSGFIEARVSRWRAQGGADVAIGDRVAPWVDVAAVRRVLRDGTAYDVLDAWRVLQVDRWLEREEQRRA